MSDTKTYTADGFDDAIIGLDTQGEVPRVVYSIELMIENLCNKQGWEIDEAIEFLDFNVFGAYLGKGTPLYIHTMTAEEVRDYVFD